MNHVARQTLVDLIAKYGRPLADNPQRCEALLRDYCGEYKREIHVLIGALKERVADELMTSSAALPAGVLRARLTQRLQDNLGLSEEASRWAVETWALALGVAPALEAEADTTPPARSATPLPQSSHPLDPNDPFAPEGPDISAQSRPEETLRQALRIVLADDHATEYEKADMRLIRQRLGIPGDVASKIFAEVKAERELALKRQQTAPAPSMTLTVSQEGTGQYAQIGQAIRRARPGARILVQSGLYSESVIIDKPIQIIADGPTGQVIVESEDSPCISAQSDQATVCGLVLRSYVNRGRGGHAAIDIEKGELVLEECDIITDSAVGVSVHGPGVNPMIRRCKIHDGGNYGIWIWDHAGGVVEDCEIFNSAGAGVIISGDTLEEAREMAAYILADISDDPDSVNQVLNSTPAAGSTGSATGQGPILRRCRIHGGQDHGVWVHYRGAGVIEHCSIFNNVMAGVWVDQSSEAALRHCLIKRNGWEAVRVTQNSSAIVEDCDLSENGNGAWAVEQDCQVRRSGNKE